jgi:two-component system, cell cycle sensor histidine kinase and response regulator CckA
MLYDARLSSAIQEATPGRAPVVTRSRRNLDATVVVSGAGATAGAVGGQWLRPHRPFHEILFVSLSPAGGEAATLSVLESRFRGAIAASLDAFFLCESVRDVSGKIVDFRVVELNARGEILLGRARIDLVGRLACEVLPTLRESRLIDQIIRVVETGESFEDELQVEDDRGDKRWIRHQAVRVDDGVAITSRDITKRRHVEESLLQSEARFRHLVESASDGIYRIDTHGVFTYANPIVARLLGCSPDEGGIIGRMYLEFVRRDYHEQGIALYKRQITERIPVTYWEFPAVTVDGRELWIGQNVHIEQRNGWVTSLFAVARDITERKRAEIALRESEARYRFLTEHSTDMLSRHTADGTIIYASPVCFTLLGYTVGELVGNAMFEFCHPDDLEAMRAATARLAGHQGAETLTYRARRRDGNYVWLETTSQAVRDPKSGLVGEVLSVSRDITERRRLEEELRQAQKMDAVGQLAGGVAHDFNNLLTTIRGFADLLARGFEADDARRKDIAEILKATERAASLTRQLLAFSKRQVLRVEALSVNSIVADMVKIIRRLLGDSIKIETVLDQKLGMVRADPGQLEQVLLNLALNARDAMPQGGTLRIATKNAEVAPVNAADTIVPAGKYVLLEIQDTGTGMTDETRARVFEPFFTTKDPTGRSGLGLATVYGIVSQSGGHISVTSSLGGGTTFSIHLPAIVIPHAGSDRAHGAAPHSSTGNAILIAEDNEGVRALTVRILTSAGYRVFEGCDGVDALETLRTLPEPVDLLISDVMMPRMNGSELAAEFQRVQPGTPILLISGYMDEDAVQRAFNEPDAILAKPFTPDALLARVRDLIGAPAL